jgi:hypothetical protein
MTGAAISAHHEKIEAISRPRFDSLEKNGRSIGKSK